MTTPLAIKRMTRERQVLEKENSDYFVRFEDNDLLEFEAYVVGPDDTLYQHKLIKLHFEIPENYPMVPPKVTFLQHSGHRIHPNLYVEGKVCLSILGTWAGEPWAFGMNCNTVLITIRSLLDNEPYKHEPGREDDPQFNRFVEYTTWRWLLLDYLEREAQPAAREFLLKHLRERGSRMMDELRRQQAAHSQIVQFASPYINGPSNIRPEYPHLIQELSDFIAEAQEQVPATSGGIKRPLDESPPAPTNVQHTTDEPERQQPKRAKTEEEDNDTSHIIDLTFSSSPEPEGSDSEGKEATGMAKSTFAPAKASAE
ncbi:hypothetical protein SLS62_008106 [Diatrype stigma]|uniref:Ubiquitin-conjugating enzyme E2 Z n=1 Tax=Diatrype stigma TaxID=117547 RepID=A0AAN9UNP8_9PEZI